MTPPLGRPSAALAQAKGFEDSLRHFVADCQRPPRLCGGRAAWTRCPDPGMLAASPRGAPRRRGGRRDRHEHNEGILHHRCYPPPLLPAELRTAGALDGTYDALMAFSDSNRGRPSGEYTSNVSMAFTAVSCLDTSSAEVTDHDGAGCPRHG
ncbi:hypothetical protein QJS66_09640 [Kocuria rhizophila]|nr:hypothetical protein QJS66_09640 [Kocuria rhizophila]